MNQQRRSKYRDRLFKIANTGTKIANTGTGYLKLSCLFDRFRIANTGTGYLKLSCLFDRFRTSDVLGGLAGDIRKTRTALGWFGEYRECRWDLGGALGGHH